MKKMKEMNINLYILSKKMTTHRSQSIGGKREAQLNFRNQTNEKYFT
jgi:hypothetical protein